MYQMVIFMSTAGVLTRTVRSVCDKKKEPNTNVQRTYMRRIASACQVEINEFTYVGMFLNARTSR